MQPSVRPEYLTRHPEPHAIPILDEDERFQPRERDLLIATHGRGIWILDDLTPVRELDPALLSAPLHLFAARPAYRFRAIRETYSAPGSDLRAENPTYGANIDYYVGAAEAAGAAEKRGRGVGRSQEPHECARRMGCGLGLG